MLPAMDLILRSKQVTDCVTISKTDTCGQPDVAEHVRKVKISAKKVIFPWSSIKYKMSIVVNIALRTSQNPVRTNSEVLQNFYQLMRTWFGKNSLATVSCVYDSIRSKSHSKVTKLHIAFKYVSDRAITISSLKAILQLLYKRRTKAFGSWLCLLFPQKLSLALHRTEANHENYKKNTATTLNNCCNLSGGVALIV